MKKRTKMTRTIVCIAVVLCITLTVGTAFAAPGISGRHAGRANVQGHVTQGTPAAGQSAQQKAQCTYPDCPRLTGGQGACVNENCQYYGQCPNQDCPQQNGGECTYANCPFDGQRPQDGTGNQAGNKSADSGKSSGTGSKHSDGAGAGGSGHRGGHQGGRHR